MDNFDKVPSGVDLTIYNIKGLSTKKIFKAFYNNQYPFDIDQDLRSGKFTAIKALLEELKINKLNTIDQTGILEMINGFLECDSTFEEFVKSTFTTVV
tara:strand:- start:109 stop:402 length:294 start_codon:yes stop_codon:yes gene_type:complete